MLGLGLRLGLGLGLAWLILGQFVVEEGDKPVFGHIPIPVGTHVAHHIAVHFLGPFPTLLAQLAPSLPRLGLGVGKLT